MSFELLPLMFLSSNFDEQEANNTSVSPSLTQNVMVGKKIPFVARPNQL
jgi:hypothetical protein